MVPKDPVMLLSYVNTQLRDFYSDLDDLCKALDLDRSQLEKTLQSIGYAYRAERNQFI